MPDFDQSQQMSTRRQATLYLPNPGAEAVESIRARFNPQQQALICAHVTLCREDEVDDWNAFAKRLRGIGKVEVELTFDGLVRDNDLLYLAPSAGTESFDALRAVLLTSDGGGPRRQAPHITLIHPRNGHCSDADFATIASAFRPFTTTFRFVTLIEQHDGGCWKNLLQHPSSQASSR